MDAPWFGPPLCARETARYVVPCPDPTHARRYLRDFGGGQDGGDGTVWRCYECAMLARHTAHGQQRARVAKALLDALAAARWGGKPLLLRRHRSHRRYVAAAGLLRRTDRGEWVDARLPEYRVYALRQRGELRGGVA